MALLTGPSITAAAGPTSQVWSTSPFPHTLGAMARDNDGNQYLYTSAVTAVSGPGILVSITADHRVAPLLHTSLLVARVGVAMARMDTNVAGWVQVPHSEAYYGADSCEAGNASDIRAGEMVTDAVDAIAALFPRGNRMGALPFGTVLVWTAVLMTLFDLPAR